MEGGFHCALLKKYSFIAIAFDTVIQHVDSSANISQHLKSKNGFYVVYFKCYLVCQEAVLKGKKCWMVGLGLYLVFT